MSAAAPAPLTRRRLLRAGPAAALALLASACGFQLRGAATGLPFERIALEGFRERGTQLALTLKRDIEADGRSRIVDAASQAQVVIEVLLAQRERVVAAQTSSGQVREFTLRSRLAFRLRTPDGRLLAPDAELVQTRDMSFNESSALAKEQEESLLYRAMEDDISAQVLRRLAVLRLPAPPATAAR